MNAKEKVRGNGRAGFLFVTAMAVLLMMLAVVQTAAAQNAVPLTNLGPVSTVYGAPVWYQDSTGMALQPCLGLDTVGTGLADPNCGLISVPGFNAGLSISFPNNFPDEFFYWGADADIVFPGGGDGLMILALEGNYNGVPDQTVFGRVRFTIDVPNDAPGTYTVTYPFGTKTFEVPATTPGSPEIRDTVDLGCIGVPINGVSSCNNPTTGFNLALDGGVGPFLKWDPAVAPAAPAGYIGNPAVTHTVVGSPTGNNFFRVTGPTAASSAETNQFTVTGKIAVIDTVAPVLTPVPKTATVGDVDVVVNADITDDLGVFTVTIDLGPVGNDFSSTINGANAGTASSATGTGTYTIDTAANTLSFNINLVGLTGERSAHIHSPTQAFFNLPLGASKIGTWNYPEALEADILAGNMFVQVHTALLPVGEISGPISPAANIQSTATGAVQRTVGIDNKAGTWGTVIPSVTRVGTFNLPVTASDGSNTATGNLVLTVVPLLRTVTVTPTSANVVVGNTQQLAASALDQEGVALAPQPAIIWSSSDLSVATVSNTGLVTAVSTGVGLTGTATITASATRDATTVTNTSTITVTPVPVLTSVGVAPATASLLVGGTQQLAASPLDQLGNAFVGSTVAWESNNTAVATVNAATGLVTGVGLGFANITVTATSGLITVTNTSQIKVAQLTSVAVTPATVALTTGGTQQLAASVLDQAGAAFVGASLNWSSDNAAAASVHNETGLVTALAPGTATITATAISGAITVTGTSTITVNAPPAPAPAPAPAASSGGGGGGGSGGGGGGGGGGGSSLPSENSLIPVKLSPGESGTFSFRKVDQLAVSEILAGFTSAVTNPSITVKEAVLSKIAPPISEAVGRTYKYLSIVSPDAKVSSATVRFSVSKVWLSDSRVSAASVRLNRLQGSQWAALPTKLLSEEGAFASYEATTPGFSIFAISGELAPFQKAAPVQAAPAPQKPAAPSQPVAVPVQAAPAPAPQTGLAPITGQVVSGSAGKFQASALNALIFAAFIALVGIVVLKIWRMRRITARHIG